ncbi:MAG: hypothetical protein U0L17_01510 [Acutalibacteraceae bacterium]|nr:hypothetical protein [Acutalibacteraceae bacterium]
MNIDFNEEEFEAIFGNILDYREVLVDLIDENPGDIKLKDLQSQYKICNSVLRKIKKSMAENNLSPYWLDLN